MKKRKLEKYEKAIKEYISSNISIISLCKRERLNRNYFSKLLKIRGIPIRENVNRKYYYDEYYFDIIDTEWKAYWLGFIAADGCVYKEKNTISIGLKKIDKKHLEKIAKIFDISIRNIERYLKETKKTYKQSYVYLYSEKMVKILIDKGITPRKSKTMTDEVFNHIPKRLLHHFIRGYFDGDGSISKNKRNRYQMSICGTKKFLNRIKNVFGIKIGTNKKIKIYKYEKIYYLKYNGNCQIIKIGKWLYNNATIFLERKKVRFDSIFSVKSN